LNDFSFTAKIKKTQHKDKNVNRADFIRSCDADGQENENEGKNKNGSLIKVDFTVFPTASQYYSQLVISIPFN
jgi:hypothetical protein